MIRNRRLSIRTLATGFAFALGLQTALAFVSQKTSSGVPVKWRASCVKLTPDTQTPMGISTEQFREQIVAAANNWTGQSQGMSYLAIEVEPTVDGMPTDKDRVNLVTFLTDCWGRSETGGCIPFSPDAPALTYLSYVSNMSSPRAGEIIDADIELNAVDARFKWSILTPGVPSPGLIDLQNTLTHEIGHLIGLDHTCNTGGSSTMILDHAGNTVPPCRPAPSAEILATTMYPFTSFGDTSMRDLEPDDKNGMWSTYPIKNDPGYCAIPLPTNVAGDEEGCTMAPLGRGTPLGSRAGYSALLLGGLVLVLGRVMERAYSRARTRSGCAVDSCGSFQSSDAASR